MEYKDFAEAMRHMVKENKDKDVLLLTDVKKRRAFILDYKGHFDTEANDFLKLLDADCAKYINEADDVLERKRQLVERMEEKLHISSKYSMPLLDLLGFLLKGDTTKCQEQAGDDPNDKGDAAWDRKDYAEAVKWYLKAAEQGHAGAQNNLAMCYAYGRGVAKDEVKAFEWLQKAAEQGNATAQLNLGACYQGGTGVSTNLGKAEEWYLKAAEQGHSYAMYTLGLYYSLLGHYAKSDKTKAKSDEWFKKAAEHGNEEAQKYLKELKAEGKI